MILLDVTSAAQTKSQTGIQKCTRLIYQELLSRNVVYPIIRDSFHKTLRSLTPTEYSNLNFSSKDQPTIKRGISLREKFFRIFFGPSLSWSTQSFHNLKRKSSVEILLVVDVFPNWAFKKYKSLQLSLNCKLIAVFHDMAPLIFPHFASKKLLFNFPSYLKNLLYFNYVKTNSENSKNELLKYFSLFQNDISNKVNVSSCRYGHIPIKYNKENFFCKKSLKLSKTLPIILNVGTIEGRKNHMTLLSVVNDLWKENIKFSLHIVGSYNKQSGKEILIEINKLSKNNQNLHYHGPLSDEKLAFMYQVSHFTIYPSLYEGFGMPVIESLYFGKPCITGEGGALKELAKIPGVCSINPTYYNLKEQIIKMLKYCKKIESMPKLTTWSEYVDNLLLL